MKIYGFQCDTNHFKTLDYDDKYDPLFDQFQDGPLEEDWKEVPVVVAENRKAPQPDLFQIDYRIPVLTSKSLNILDEQIPVEIERLKLQCESVELYALNLSQDVDCLVEESSDLRRNQFGNIITITHAVFKESAVSHLGLFRIEKHGSIFITEPVMEKIRAENLKGLTMKEIGETK